MYISGARIVIETLIEQGCEVMFGYPGGQIMPIYDEIEKNAHRIRHILTAHEQGACHAADGYARTTGKVGVVAATSGPGATNLVTGIANAFLDSVPMVAITGNVPCSLIGRDSFQEVDITGVTMPITKHNFIVTDVSKLADTIREAFKIAKSDRPGPVLVDIPKDVQTNKCDFEPTGIVQPGPLPTASDDQLKKAAEIIASANRPYIYCGGGVVSGGASEEVLALAEKIDAYIGCSMMGLSAVPSSSVRNLGMHGMHGHYASSMAQNDADLIIAVGARFSDRATGNKQKFAVNAKIIHIDIDCAELDKNIPVYLGIQSEVKNALSRLLKILPEYKHPEWNEHVDALKAREAEIAKLGAARIPYGAIDAVARVAGKETTIVTDVGQHQMWTVQRYPFETPKTLITSGGLGTMGFGMGAAIGSAAATGRKTVLITGDGSFGMNLNELATAVSQNSPLVIVIMNNGVLGMVRQWQTLFFDKNYSSTTLNRKTDFVKLAEAFGAKGMRPSGEAELEEALKEAFAADGTVVIDYHILNDEMVLPMLPPNGSIDSMIVEIK